MSLRAFTARLALLALATGLATPAMAQRLEDVSAGSTVRIRYGTPTIAVVRGKLISADSEFVAVRSDGRDADAQRVPFPEITRLESLVGLRTPNEARRHGAWRGTLVGLGATTIMLASTRMNSGKWGAPCKIRRNLPFFLLDYRSATTVGLSATAVSAIVGAAIGNRHRERWRRVGLPWSQAVP
jgi:hypothetical protein